MSLKVRIRIDKATGGCELRLEHSSNLPRAQHDAEADRWAAALGGLLEQYPWVEELAPGPEPALDPTPAPTPEPTHVPESPARRRREHQGL